MQAGVHPPDKLIPKKNLATPPKYPPNPPQRFLQYLKKISYKTLVAIVRLSVDTAICNKIFISKDTQSLSGEHLSQEMMPCTHLNEVTSNKQHALPRSLISPSTLSTTQSMTCLCNNRPPPLSLLEFFSPKPNIKIQFH